MVVVGSECSVSLHAAPLRTRLGWFADPFLLVWVRACVHAAPPPTPTASSTVEDVKKWLQAFAVAEVIPFQELAVFARSGETLLALTKKDCLRRSPCWGDIIYNALHQAPTGMLATNCWSCWLAVVWLLSLSLSLCVSLRLSPRHRPSRTQKRRGDLCFCRPSLATWRASRANRVRSSTTAHQLLSIMISYDSQGLSLFP